MGCDGGTIPKRDELVRTKKKPEQKDKTSELAFKWKHCAISQEDLSKPIVACELGRLYNKESVLEFLLDRSKFELASQFDHLRGLKDIKELNLTGNPERRKKDADKGDAYIDSSVSDFICPVVGLEMSGKYKFCFIWTCGCVISDRALKGVKSDVCHKCGKSFKEEDLVILNGSEEELETMRAKMEARRLLAKASKKSKKAEKHKIALDSHGESSASSKKLCTEETDSSLPSSSSSSSLTSKLVNGASKSKLTNGHTKGKLAASTNGKPASETAGAKGKRSIQDDPRASKTFKSLFTSSEKAKSQQQPHWITYNPMYY